MKNAAATVGLAQIVRGNLPLVVIQFPSGTWGFVGRVPASLSLVMKDGSPVTPEAAKIASGFGPALANVKTRAWATKGEALAAATVEGFEVAS
jgi:hypothetical protein